MKYPHPLPLVPLAIEQLWGFTLFTNLDLRSAYNLHIRAGTERRTAFSTTSGHYEYKVMSYGLVNAPSYSQAFINFSICSPFITTVSETLNRLVVVYLDNILMYSLSLSAHIAQVKSVLRHLLDHGLYVKAEKISSQKSCLSVR